VDALIFSKGAIDSLLKIVDHVWIENRIEPLDARWQEQILASHDQLAQDGLRVLGVAYRPLDLDGCTTDPLEQNLTFIGFVGMLDPARPEVQEAIQLCQGAGIRVVMITGDHPLTAHHIASDLGITLQGRLLTGQALARLSAAELADIVETVEVYARVSPEDKLKIVKALQQRGHIVAMTGDGVNDAPALKQADIGVAMGITGTDVSKEAADIVLQDDNFATMVAAVQEGRVIYDNIRKFIQYTLTGNAGQLWLLFLAPFLGMPLPLTPIQILWINLIADGLLAVALSFEPAEPGVMRRPPYPPQESIFARGMGRDILWVGFLLGLVLLGVAYGYWANGLASWQTMVFTTLAFSRIGLSETVRSAYSSVLELGLFSNPRLLGAVALTLTLQMVIIYVPVLQTFFGTLPLSGQEIAIALLLSTLSPLSLELKKQVVRPAR
jgi:Ca2+-transporting ATPase